MQKRTDLGGERIDPQVTIDELRAELSVLSSENVTLRVQLADKDKQIRAFEEREREAQAASHADVLPKEQEAMRYYLP